MSPLVNKDVFLGAPWFHRVYGKLEFSSRFITLCTNDREFNINTQELGNTIPIVINDSVSKLIKSSLLAYFVCV